MTQITIDSQNHDQRFDRFLRKYFKNQTNISLSMIYGAIRKRLVTVNGKKSKEDYRLKNGDIIAFDDKFSEGQTQAPKPHTFVFDEKRLIKNCSSWILFENEHRLVFNKPVGISMQRSNDDKDPSLQEHLNAYTKELKTSTFTPAFCYRLDKDTSGVLIAAKSYDALQYLNKLIRDRETEKTYKAIVIGKTPQEGVVEKALTKAFSKNFGRGKTVIDEEGKPSKTSFFTEKTRNHPLLGTLSLVKVHIETGRMHQIRAHMASIGFPLLGDLVYGKPSTNRVLFKTLKIKHFFLHCQSYSFWDIFIEKKQTFEAQIPSYFTSLS